MTTSNSEIVEVTEHVTEDVQNVSTFRRVLPQVSKRKIDSFERFGLILKKITFFE